MKLGVLFEEICLAGKNLGLRKPRARRRGVLGEDDEERSENCLPIALF